MTPLPHFTRILVLREMAKVPERRHVRVFSGHGNPQQNMDCTTAGTYPDFYDRLFENKEKNDATGIRNIIS
jgi:hypothetical protein